jgi:hypothetical protein
MVQSVRSKIQQGKNRDHTSRHESTQRKSHRNPQNQSQQHTLNEDIHIASDGEAIRSLGAWVGNETQNAAPWETIIDNIKKSLQHWSDTHPSIYGKKLIAQAVVGGRTQFITKAQGMPDNVSATLAKIMRDFIWENTSKPRLALGNLQERKVSGGIELVNLENRNDAIELIWLKEYLSESTNRPTWAYMTDILLNETAPKNLPEEARVNTFLQKWEAPTRGKRANKLGEDTVRMLKKAKKYEATFAPVRIGKTLMESMPAWLHLGHQKTVPQNTQSRCLINNHSAKNTKDLREIRRSIQKRSTHPHLLMPLQRL